MREAAPTVSLLGRSSAAQILPRIGKQPTASVSTVISWEIWREFYEPIWTRPGPAFGFAVSGSQRGGFTESCRRRFTARPTPIEPLTK